jgi:hypothetical protein
VGSWLVGCFVGCDSHMDLLLAMVPLAGGNLVHASSLIRFAYPKGSAVSIPTAAERPGATAGRGCEKVRRDSFRRARGERP